MLWQMYLVMTRDPSETDLACICANCLSDGLKYAFGALRLRGATICIRAMIREQFLDASVCDVNCNKDGTFGTTPMLMEWYCRFSEL